MKKLVKLKIRRGDELVSDNEGSISIENCYRKQFESYINKKGEGCRVYCKVPDEDWNKELDIYYQDVFPTKQRAIEEWEKFLSAWLGDVKVTYL